MSVRYVAFAFLWVLLAGCTSPQSDARDDEDKLVACDPLEYIRSDDPAISELTDVAESWLNSLDEGMLRRVRYCLGDQEMYSWTNVPGDRSGGIELREMSREQQQLAWSLVSAFMSESGLVKAKLIVNEITQVSRSAPLGSHTVAIFGVPGQDGAWGFQVDGHHLALNFLVQEADVLLAPAFIGTRPLSVDGDAPLGDESRLGRDLIAAFNEDERALAKQDSLIGEDVLAGSGDGQLDRGRTYDVSQFDGIGARISSLSERSAYVVNEVIDEYINNLAEPFAGRVRATVDDSLDKGFVVFDNRKEDIYYRIFIPNRMLIEYNDVSSDHIHTILRLLGEEPYSDYGAYAQKRMMPRTIAEHYHTSPHHQVALTN